MTTAQISATTKKNPICMAAASRFYAAFFSEASTMATRSNMSIRRVTTSPAIAGVTRSLPARRAGRINPASLLRT